MKLKHRINDIDRRREKEGERESGRKSYEKGIAREEYVKRCQGNSKERREEGRKSARKELGWVKEPQGEKEISGIRETIGRKRRRRNSGSGKNNVGPRKKGLNDKRKAQEENSRDERSVRYKKGIPAIETKRAVS